MKQLLWSLVLLFLVSISLANDKGNGLEDLEVPAHYQAMDIVLDFGLKLETETYPLMMTQKKLQLAGDRTSSSVLRLLAQRSSSASVIDLKPHTHSSSKNSSAEMKNFLIIVRELIKLNEWELLGEITFDNEAFYASFNVRKIYQEISTSDLPDSMKTILMRRVSDVEVSFWRMVKAYVSSTAGTQGWKKFSSLVAPAKLGIDLSVL